MPNDKTELQSDLRRESVKQYSETSTACPPGIILPEKPVFHYTSQKGLLGIISDQAMWATNILYLNDAKEIKLAVDLAKEEIRIKRQESSALKNADDILDTIESNIVVASSTTKCAESIFVCSFCEEGNILSQWRGYRPGGNGFSIGFDLAQLQETMTRQGFQIAKCIYDEDEQKNIIAKFLQEAMDSLRCSLTSNIFHRQLKAQEEIWINFLQLAAKLKDKSFSDEKEWRLISEPIPPTRSADSPVKFREGKSMIIPYFNLKLADEHMPLSISEIYIGPTVEMDLAYKAVCELLFANGIDTEKCPVTQSKIPYRTTM